MKSRETVTDDKPPQAAREWAVAVFAARESLRELAPAIDAIRMASRGTPTIIDVLVNGNAILAQEMAARASCAEWELDAGNGLRVWNLATPDKAHAWNSYLHKIRPDAKTYFFIDGYARVSPDALRLLAQALSQNGHALGATGTPSAGRSASRMRAVMLSQGGIHGNLYALSHLTVQRLVEAGFHMPLALYRTDGVLGAVLYYDMDPGSNSWDTRRILVHPQATWSLPPARFPVSLEVGRTYLNRLIRQAQGELENRAFRQHLSLDRKGPEHLPRLVSELVEQWIAKEPEACRRICLRNPLCLVAMRKLRKPRDWSSTRIPPRLVACFPPVSHGLTCQAGVSV